MCQKYLVSVFFMRKTIFLPIFFDKIRFIFADFLYQNCSNLWCTDWQYFLPNFCVEIGYIFCEFLCQDYCDFLRPDWSHFLPNFCAKITFILVQIFLDFDGFLCRKYSVSWTNCCADIANIIAELCYRDRLFFCRIFVPKIFQFFDDFFLSKLCWNQRGSPEKSPLLTREYSTN